MDRHRRFVFLDRGRISSPPLDVAAVPVDYPRFRVKPPIGDQIEDYCYYTSN
jgi:hypothetical protein